MHNATILSFAKYRYLWLSVLLVLGATILYLSHNNDSVANGGTWQGYVLGTVGVLLILWLALLGLRKRSYSSRLGTVMGWTSAHVYLGIALIWIATLHTGFEFAWNVHLLAYLFMMLVIISGIIGISLYALFPKELSKIRNGKTIEILAQNAKQQQHSIISILPHCDALTRKVVISAFELAQGLGASIHILYWRDTSKWECPQGEGDSLVFVKESNTEQLPIRRWLTERIVVVDSGTDVHHLRLLLEQYSNYTTLIKKIRTERRAQAMFKLWLSIHVPSTIILIVALASHILSTFLYW